MAHLPLLVALLALALATGGRAQDIFIKGSRPYILLPPTPHHHTPTHPSRQEHHSLRQRSGLYDDSSEENLSADDDEERIVIQNGSSKGFPEDLDKDRRFPVRKKTELKADPASLDKEEDTGLGYRFLWPFHVSVSKTKGHPGDFHHAEYHDHYPAHTPSHHKAKKGYDVLTDDFKGLTPHDYEVLNSKGYKKYQKKKKKKIKKIKKKLKMKRVIQKILDKKISYLDSLAPEYY